MTLADSCTDCRTRLVACAIVDSDVGARQRPSSHLEVSSVKDGLVGEDQVLTLVKHLSDLLGDLDELLLELVHALRVPLRLSLHDDLLLRTACLPHQLAQHPRPDDPIRKLSVEANTPLRKRQRCPKSQVLFIK